MPVSFESLHGSGLLFHKPVAFNLKKHAPARIAQRTDPTYLKPDLSGISSSSRLLIFSNQLRNPFRTKSFYKNVNKTQ